MTGRVMMTGAVLLVLLVLCVLADCFGNSNVSLSILAALSITEREREKHKTHTHTPSHTTQHNTTQRCCRYPVPCGDKTCRESYLQCLQAVHEIDARALQSSERNDALRALTGESHAARDATFAAVATAQTQVLRGHAAAGSELSIVYNSVCVCVCVLVGFVVVQVVVVV